MCLRRYESYVVPVLRLPGIIMNSKIHCAGKCLLYMGCSNVFGVSEGVNSGNPRGGGSYVCVYFLVFPWIWNSHEGFSWLFECNSWEHLRTTLKGKQLSFCLGPPNTLLQVFSAWFLLFGDGSKPCTPFAHIQVAGKWMFIPQKMLFTVYSYWMVLIHGHIPSDKLT